MVKQAVGNTTRDAKIKAFFFLVIGIIVLVLTMWAIGVLKGEVAPRVIRRFFDRPVLDFLIDLRSGGLTSIMKLFTLFGSTLFGILALLVLAVVSFSITRDVRFPIFFVFLLLGLFWIDDLIKQLVTLGRPPVRALVDASGPSFPSGHATVAAGLAYAVAFFVIERQPLKPMTWVWPVTVTVASLVGFSRCYLGVAWPTDVLSGFALGAGFAMIVGTSVKLFFGYQRLWPRRARA